MDKARFAVRRLSAGARRGWLELGPFRWPCSLGRSGISAFKREGDGATPRGRFRILAGHFRADRFARLPSVLALQPIRQDSGWCDASTDRNYNRCVRLPYEASAEQMWRADGLYDAVLVIDYNCRPRQRGRGSAIFLHIAREGYAPTEGCIAISPSHMRLLLSHLPRSAYLVIA